MQQLHRQATAAPEAACCCSDGAAMRSPPSAMPLCLALRQLQRHLPPPSTTAAAQPAAADAASCQCSLAPQRSPANCLQLPPPTNLIHSTMPSINSSRTANAPPQTPPAAPPLLPPISSSSSSPCPLPRPPSGGRSPPSARACAGGGGGGGMTPGGSSRAGSPDLEVESGPEQPALESGSSGAQPQDLGELPPPPPAPSQRRLDEAGHPAGGASPSPSPSPSLSPSGSLQQPRPPSPAPNPRQQKALPLHLPYGIRTRPLVGLAASRGPLGGGRYSLAVEGTAEEAASSPAAAAAAGLGDAISTATTTEAAAAAAAAAPAASSVTASTVSSVKKRRGRRPSTASKSSIDLEDQKQQQQQQQQQQEERQQQDQGLLPLPTRATIAAANLPPPVAAAVARRLRKRGGAQRQLPRDARALARVLGRWGELVEVFGGEAAAVRVLSRRPQLFARRPETLAARVADVQVRARGGERSRIAVALCSRCDMWLLVCWQLNLSSHSFTHSLTHSQHLDRELLPTPPQSLLHLPSPAAAAAVASAFPELLTRSSAALTDRLVQLEAALGLSGAMTRSLVARQPSLLLLVRVSGGFWGRVGGVDEFWGA